MINKNYAFAVTIVLFFGFKCCAMDREGFENYKKSTENFKKQSLSLFELIEEVVCSDKDKISRIKKLFKENVELIEKNQNTISKIETTVSVVEEFNKDNDEIVEQVKKLREEVEKFAESSNK